MEHAYVYGWQLRPEENLEVELRIEAPSAAVARREVALFLEHHDGLRWQIRGVKRWVSEAAARSQRSSVIFVEANDQKH